MIEYHPLEPFVPDGARMLMLGSFPPPRERWAMEFYYPNLQNDMWRIFGIVFFGDRDYFLEEVNAKKIFSKQRIEEFLRCRGIALSDTAVAVVRHKGNASDKFLDIVEPRDIAALLASMPRCTTLVTTGDKATQTLVSMTGSPEPKTGSYVPLEYAGRSMRHYRMPSSSRAYPLAIEKKAAAYAAMFRETGFLSDTNLHTI